MIDLTLPRPTSELAVNRRPQWRILTTFAAVGAALLTTATAACTSDSQGPPAEARHYVALSVGPGHTCALTADHAAWCWGNNADGKLGAGPTGAGDQLVPTPVAGGIAFTDISAGESHTCGVATDGRGYCWGANGVGALGTGEGLAATHDGPVEVAGDLRFTRISAGAGFSCGVTTTGDAYCWGDNQSGNLGVGDNEPRTTPTLVTGGLSFSFIATSKGGTPSNWFACGLTTAGAAYCWGANDGGELGTGSVSLLSAEPVHAAPALTFESLSLGDGIACGVSTAHDAYCWGTTPTVTIVPGERKWLSIRLGDASVCGVTDAGDGFCWGTNPFGMLGNGLSASVSYAEPTPIVGGLTLQVAAPGRSHSCGLAADGSAYCWGLGILLGIGPLPDFPSPYVKYEPTAVVSE